MNEVVVRLGTSIGLILYYFNFINFYQFLLVFIGLTGSITLALSFQIWRSGEFKIKYRGEFFKNQTNALIQYGFFTLLAGSTFLLVQKLDKIFLTHFKGDSAQGVYSIFLYIIAVIRIPSIAIGRVSYQLVADFWENKNFLMVEEIYKKTSLVQMIIGLFLFLGLALNREFLLFVLKKEAFQSEFPIFYVLGLAVLVDTTTGLNTYILTVSHKFRISTGILMVSVLVCIVSNLILTPGLGTMGAALSLLITYFFYNFFNTLYLQIRFQLQPFSLAHFKVALIGILTYASIYFIPSLGNHYLDLAVRSILTVLIFGGLILGLHVSEDINDQAQVFLEKGLAIFRKG
jgi:O-antigen/teichoic acid export membrane protein